MPNRRDKWEIGSLRSWPATSDAPALDVAVWQASSNRMQAKVATDFADLASGKNLATESAYTDGVWQLLIRRPLQGTEKTSVKLSSQNPVLVGIAVWDGSNRESGRHRANSNWVDLTLE